MNSSPARRLQLALIVLVVATILGLAIATKSVAVPFTLGALITYLLNPLVIAFERRGTPRGVAIIIIYVLLITITSISLAVLIPVMTRELQQLYEVLPQQAGRLEEIIASLYDKYSRYDVPPPFKGVLEGAIDKFEFEAMSIVKDAAQAVLSFASNILSFMLAPFVAYYLTKDLEPIKRRFGELLPASYRNEVLHVLGEVDVVLGGYIRGQLIISSFIFLVVSASLTALGVNFALILGLFAGLTNIIPYFGPFIGAIPAIAVALLESPLRALYVGILFIAIHQVESAIISPRILGERVGLHPLVVILAVLLAERLFGTIGLIAGVPIVAVMNVIASRLWRIMLSGRTSQKTMADGQPITERSDAAAKSADHRRW